MSYLSPVEHAIRQAMKDGLFDNLPGEGKPLNLGGDHDPNTPEDQRMAYKIMKDNDIAPDWMMLRAFLDEQQVRIRRELARGLKAYQNTLHEADRHGDIGKRSRANRTWERLLRMFEDAIHQYNNQVMLYNLKVPPGMPHLSTMSLSSELANIKK
jgi:DnaJ homolog subfamily C member 28